MDSEYFSKHICNNTNHDKHLCVPAHEGVLDERGLGPCILEKMREYRNNVAQVDCVSGNEETYGELLSRCIRVAKKIKDLGITSEDIISVCTYNNMDCYVPVIASLWLNIRIAPLDPTLSLQDTTYMLNLVKPSLIFCDDAGAKLIEEVNADNSTKYKIVYFGKTDKHMPFSEFLLSSIDEDDFEATTVKDIRDTAAVIFSSGTTGTPKGICISHYSYLYSLQNHLHSGAVYIITRLFWLSGLFSLIIPTLSGGRWLISNETNEEKIIDIINKYQVSFLIMPPFYAYKINQCKREGELMPDVQAIIILGDLIGKDAILELKKHCSKAVVFTVYGLSETCGSVTGFNPLSPTDMQLATSKLISVGRVIPGHCVKVVDVETQKEVGPNTVGEIRTKSVTIMNGHYNNAKATAESFDSEGYLCTGDLGYYDEDFCFFVTDRIKNVLKFRGWKVATGEMESVLLTHPDVIEAAVIGMPHAEDGHHLTGVVVIRSGSNILAEDIVKYVDERVADAKRLRGGVKIVENLPRTPSTKIQKKYIRDLLLDGKL